VSLKTLSRRTLSALAALLCSLALMIVVSPAAKADGPSCFYPLTPGTTWETWSLDHHFDVELYGWPNMAPMVDSGTAAIYYLNEYTGSWDRMRLSAWDINKWGVPTSWVVPAHVFTGFFDASRWRIVWPNGANGITCPLA
jgi:hypothetical protein